MERLPTWLWVDALIRRVEVAGASAFVVQKGDHSRGDTLIKVARLDGTAAVYLPSTNLDGERVFLNLIVQGVGPDEASVDAYVTRARQRDSDLWIVEIEDREGRHFLTEEVEGDAG
ncbi:DUF1491 family protein [Hyphomonas johnsonii]|jgi:hypothetical protein|uniref:ATP-dependent Zn protease n=1 Tax=Hyphomonas johnsonii MHS-2 TaxID=1280950 RepID=A0A059FSZ4_9PROT|nr:DUF1491 family protein [Hyphomonas johnsonii]KCZ93742.1 hypothetical protein HJO_00160 [Hyphomonas johnsonii MHS-2]